MEHLRITSCKLTDGSDVWQVRFRALHDDGNDTEVSLEVYSRKDAEKIFDAINDSCAYAETNSTDRKPPKSVSPQERRLRMVQEQRQWIHDHGGDEAGYVARYGSASDPNHYGDGGEAIYAADMAALWKLLDNKS